MAMVCAWWWSSYRDPMMLGWCSLTQRARYIYKYMCVCVQLGCGLGKREMFKAGSKLNSNSPRTLPSICSVVSLILSTNWSLMHTRPSPHIQLTRFSFTLIKPSLQQVSARDIKPMVDRLHKALSISPWPHFLRVRDFPSPTPLPSLTTWSQLWPRQHATSNGTWWLASTLQQVLLQAYW